MNRYSAVLAAGIGLLAAIVATAALLTGPAGTVAAQPSEAYRLDAVWPSDPGPRPAGFLRQPAGLAADADGRVFVVDTQRGMVHVFRDGTWQDVWGGTGPGIGQLAEPHGIALLGDQVLVADTGNRRVAVFEKDGRAVTSWTDVGTPWDVAVADVGVLVSDQAGDQVIVLDTDGRRVGTLGHSGQAWGELLAPTGLTAWPDGSLAVVDSGNRRVQVWAPDGSVRRVITSTDVRPLVDVAAGGPSRLLIANQRWVQDFDLERGVNAGAGLGPTPGTLNGVAVSPTGAGGVATPTVWTTVETNDRAGLRRWVGALNTPAETWLGLPSPAGELIRPQRIAVAGDVAWLLDGAPRLQRFGTDGTPLGQVELELASEVAPLGADDVLLADGGGVGLQRGVSETWRWQPAVPPVWINAVAADPTVSRALALDVYGQRIHELALDGSVVATRTLNLDPAGDYQAYADLTVAEDGRRMVVNRSGGRLDVYAADGTPTDRWPVPGVPLRADAGPDGATFVLNRDGQVWKLAADGAPLAWWDATEDGTGVPTDVAAGADGRVYVVDTTAEEVRVYAPDPTGKPLPPPSDGGCRFSRDKWAAPPRIRLGETVNVTLTVSGQCLEETGVDVMLVLDRSGSMAGRKLDTARSAAVDFVGEMNFDISRVGLVVFNAQATQPMSLTDRPRDVVDAVIGFGRATGGTDIGEGIQLAAAELAANGRPGVPQMLVVMTDGRPEGADVDADGAAAAAKAAGARIFSIGFGNDVDLALMRRIASAPGDYFFAPSTAELGAIYTEIARRIAGGIIAPTAVITDQVPLNMTYLPGSAVPPIVAYQNNVLRWEFSDVRAGLQLGYRLEPQEVGTWPTNVDARMAYRDGLGKDGELVFPIPQVVVVAPPRPPLPIYLPFLDHLRCRPVETHADVALVIDTSSTMTGDKLAAAKAAAQLFVDRLDLPADRAAVIGFNRTATLASGLSDDRRALRSAIDGLSIVPGTVIDGGLRLATAELTGPRGRPDTTHVIVLLSDGQNNAGPAPVRQAAAEARTAGILAYAVAFGEGADLGLLGEVAGDPRRLYVALGSEDLERIYGEIAGVIGCR